MNLPGHIDVPCDLCGNREYKVFTFDKDHCDFQPRKVKCKKCGLVYANPQATFVNLEGYGSNLFNSGHAAKFAKFHEEKTKKSTEILLEVNFQS
ncbi:MAG: hypothetical protein SCARUB_04669 [Candidatus Scalindua rubra]|uniref:Uncharacterized protein n=1 Tax=Candidatus Scalindua rubra TaxID=1872076 RepID=A0A1E3X3Q3_9BACT|nr:MAG: hypothetical protein SCARUB_04669 [Candidatus Scalindua rubra]